MDTASANQVVTEDFEKHGVFVGQPAFYQCFDTIWLWIDIGSLIGQLMKHGLVSDPDILHYINSHIIPPRERAYNLLTKVAPQAGNYGFHLLYMCIRDAHENIGHQDAADLLKKHGDAKLPDPMAATVPLPTQLPSTPQFSSGEASMQSGSTIGSANQVVGLKKIKKKTTTTISETYVYGEEASSAAHPEDLTRAIQETGDGNMGSDEDDVERDIPLKREGNVLYPSRPTEEKVKQVHDSGHTEAAATVREIDFSDLGFEEGDRLMSEVCTSPIYKGYWKPEKRFVAIKQVAGNIGEKEIRIHSQMNHPNIIHLHGVAKRNPEVYLIMDFAERGSLYDILHKYQYHPEYVQCLKWAKEIAEGMNYLHQRNVIHRDLKSPNVLLIADQTVKLCDFGAAKEFDFTKVGTNIGTVRWMAPEVMKKEPVSRSCDVFSYGMVLLELLTYKLPFAGVEDPLVPAKIFNGEVPSIPVPCEPYLADLLKSCWKINPKDRPSFSEILTRLNH